MGKKDRSRLAPGYQGEQNTFSGSGAKKTRAKIPVKRSSQGRG